MARLYRVAPRHIIVGNGLLPDVVIPTENDWTGQGEVLAAGAAGQWDARLDGSYTPCAVIHFNGTYYLYYIGADGNRTGDGGPNNRRLGVATSTDGISFTKFGSNPILEWSPNSCTSTNDEEGFFSAPAFLHGGTFYVFAGVMSDVGCNGNVDAKPRLYTSTNGTTFADQGDPFNTGAGEDYPVAVWRRSSDGVWFVYYASNVTGGDGVVRYASGTNPMALADQTQVLATQHSGGGNVFEKSETELVVHIGTSIGTLDMALYTPTIANPAALGTPDVTYDFSDYRRGVIMLDRDAGLWRIYHRIADDSAIHLKTAPIVFA